MLLGKVVLGPVHHTGRVSVAAQRAASATAAGFARF